MGDLVTLGAGELVDAAAVRIGKMYAKVRRASEGAVVGFLACGHALTEQKATMAHGQWGRWLTENEGVLAFDQNAANRMMKAAAKYAPAHNLTGDDYRAISRDMWGHTGRHLYNTGWSPT